MLMNRQTLLPLLAFVALATFGCGPDNGNARFSVRESVNQLHITHADPGAPLGVYDAQGQLVQMGTADPLGSLLFRHVDAGPGYVVRVQNSDPPEYSRQLTVMSVDGSLPSQDFYSGQKLAPGFGYIKTRDGTQLSIYVTLPGPPENGPYPTVVDYSGYAPSKPGMPVDQLTFLCNRFPSLCDSPNDPNAALMALFGYATVSVNMRGTGCSGGAYDYFETLQQLDGYDVIETVAAQDFVAFHKVGMVGLSYPGIAELFVASTQPPSLAAIAPQSVIGNTQTTLIPGGILNSGFAVEWAKSVLDGAAPYGGGWEQMVVDGGDATCAENQLLHGQKVDNVALAEASPFYSKALFDPLNPTLFAPMIKVPVFLSDAWQDEQTGPYFTTLLERFTGAPFTRYMVYNGVHTDGFVPQVLGEVRNFLDFFVARRIPVTDAQTSSLFALLSTTLFKSDLSLPPDRFANYKSYDEALAAYRAEPVLHVLFENGGGDDPGAPQALFEKTFGSFPPASTTPLRYYFHQDGSLSDTMPTEAAAASAFKLDPDNGARGNLMPGADVSDKLPAYDYRPLRPDYAVAFQTAPLPADLVLLGTASADLWIRSTADDADLQVVVTEVRPDGNEMYVQAGFLRASDRALDPSSTALWPVPTYLQPDSAPLPAGTWTQVRVPVPGFGHVFRAGSRIRVSVDTPGGTRPSWRFQLKTWSGPVTHSIAHSAAFPSSIALPLQDNQMVPTKLPACPSLRGQPCRPYMPLVNSPAPI